MKLKLLVQWFLATKNRFNNVKQISDKPKQRKKTNLSESQF